MATINIAINSDEAKFESEYKSIVAGEAAHEVIRKYSPRLCPCFVTGDIPIQLYAEKLIDQVTFEKCVEHTTGLVTTEKSRLILLDVQRSVKRDSDGINKLCSILRQEKNESESLSELAEELEGTQARIAYTPHS